MKFVALISGGKDSFFNIHHCISKGHELVALANLYPDTDDKEEIDSFMFQTAGHGVIKYYSEALDVPLYRRRIQGSSKNQALEYSKTEDDEIEDLETLLREVLTKHSDIEAISSGAILSHYQRNRVENVASRLGLISLAYLWQRDQLELMGEMCASGMDARIIKVAAVGLNETHLGKSLTELFPLLIKLNSIYQVHICGEGGEFETIVLDSPLFKKKKLSIVQREVLRNVGDDVAHLKLDVELVDKDNEQQIILNEPKMLEPNFEDIYNDLLQNVNAYASSKASAFEFGKVENETHQVFRVIDNGTNIFISNLGSTKSTLSEQVAEVFHYLEGTLCENNLTLQNVLHVTLVLKNMEDFSEINKIYESKFNKYLLPPSRVCVESILPEGEMLNLSVSVEKNNTKQGIFIRSRSFWAPQNIGPYSQAIVEKTRRYKKATLSGQIPLIPSSMDLASCNSTEEKLFSSVLSLQHLHRVKELISVSKLGVIVSYVTSSLYSEIAKNVWSQYTESEGSTQLLQKLLILQVKRLPKDAGIEWSGLSFDDNSDYNEYDDDDDNDHFAAEDTSKKCDNDISRTVAQFESPSEVFLHKGRPSVSLLFTNRQADIFSVLNTACHTSNHFEVFISCSNSENHNYSFESKCQVFYAIEVMNYRAEKYKFALIWYS
ncbi:Piso0_000337 [Millerozyma farinosa CBS 7064]|uniref:Diphthine--ammonia ligase n=1 Tax=Pichia sorbitophila (strain ATCC MYA-4447 / BCRC 22081 / CBS 7064 / NBRC 10061 / NRRL Y-12695) TaxID=559304 RepID=G8YTQ3_PICSO|nr:Piso0_000337 [Millerozyma farinosa CBS 7064]CCE73304.1 Piso0_000337 [Millerozyma farinosa CBS 7064]